VQKDIIKSLKLKNSQKYIASFNRDNLFLQIAPKSDPFTQTVKLLEKYPKQSGIIYCFSRKQVDELYEEDDVQIIVATIAFGMGINKPNVRFVIHYDLPKNIESYYQEIGRAGRDGLRSHCLLLFGYGDINKINYFIDQKEEKERRIAKMHLNSLISFAESYDCRRIQLLNYFGENHKIGNCEMCDNCTTENDNLVDVTIEAQKFLSCIKRTGEIFGGMYIIDVLRGSRSQKVIKNNHQNLSTYGIGNELSKEQWLNLSRQFVQKKLIEKDFEYGSLIITNKGRDVIKGKLQVKGKLIEEDVSYTIRPKEALEYDQNLFELLRTKRKFLADNANVPPYVIFPDKTLMEMASYFPQSETSLSHIHGVGELKLKKYGKHFLNEIIHYCRSKNISENFSGKISKSKSNASFKLPRHILVGNIYKECNTFNDLITRLNLKPSTAISHLVKYVREGNKLNTQMLKNIIEIDENKHKEIYKAFDKLGADYLRPVFDELNETVDYETLRILQICYINEKL